MRNTCSTIQDCIAFCQDRSMELRDAFPEQALAFSNMAEHFRILDEFVDDMLAEGVDDPRKAL